MCGKQENFKGQSMDKKDLIRKMQMLNFSGDKDSELSFLFGGLSEEEYWDNLMENVKKARAELRVVIDDLRKSAKD